MKQSEELQIQIGQIWSQLRGGVDKIMNLMEATELEAEVSGRSGLLESIKADISQKLEFGLTNSSACLQHYMEWCLEDLRDEVCVPYLDNVLVFSSSLSNQIKNVRQVLR